MGNYFAGYGTNIYTQGYMFRGAAAWDFSWYPIYCFGFKPRYKYKLQSVSLLSEAILERKGDIDAVEWLTLAKHFQKTG